MSLADLVKTLQEIQGDIKNIRDEAKVSHKDICENFDNFKSRFDYLEKREDILSEKDGIDNQELRSMKCEINQIKQKGL